MGRPRKPSHVFVKWSSLWSCCENHASNEIWHMLKYSFVGKSHKICTVLNFIDFYGNLFCFHHLLWNVGPYFMWVQFKLLFSFSYPLFLDNEHVLYFKDMFQEGETSLMPWSLHFSDSKSQSSLRTVILQFSFQDFLVRFIDMECQWWPLGNQIVVLQIE